MAVTRRGYIFGVVCASVCNVLVVSVCLATDNWVESTDLRSTPTSPAYSINYGLFGGQFSLLVTSTPTVHPLYMVCVFSKNACAVSCKTESEARREEVIALANKFRPNAVCNDVTTVDKSNPLDESAVIPVGIYISLIIFLALQLMFSFLSLILGLVNAFQNPTESVFGLPGLLWSNVINAVIGTVVLLIWGIYWAVSALYTHLAFSYTAVGELIPVPILGYSYWLLIVAVSLSFANIVILEVRKYLLEKDPPPPEITIENHSDGTIFLY